jgi:hypothetical protein
MILRKLKNRQLKMQLMVSFLLAVNSMCSLVILKLLCFTQIPTNVSILFRPREI